MITLPVPLHQNDMSFYNTSFSIPLPPPYFTDPSVMGISIPRSYSRDISSEKEVIDEQETISMIMNPDGMVNTSCYDPATDQISQRPYDPAKPKYLILTKDGVTVDPKAFSVFIRKQME